MKITLFDRNPDLIAKLEAEFQCHEDISLFYGDLTDLPPHDYLVTAGNSYGVMTGGIDLAARNLLGYGIQDQIQDFLLRWGGGTLPVGHAFHVKTGHTRFPNLIYVPTMVRPEIISPLNVVSAMAAALLFEHKEASIAIPGLGTGAGQLPFAVAAQAMHIGYKVFLEVESFKNSETDKRENA